MRSFQFRVALCFVAVLALFLIGVTRVLVIDRSPIVAAAIESHSYSLTVASLRGNIFDCTGKPLTGRTEKQYAVFAPTPSAILYASRVLSGDEKSGVLAALNKGKPAAVLTEKSLFGAGVTNVTAAVHTESDMRGVHLLGYIDSSGHGVCGLEKAFDSVLYTDRTVGVRYELSGNGTVLGGIDGIAQPTADILQSGIKTTIDYNIQVLTEAASEKISCGSVVVSEIASGKIRAMVSCPGFDPTNPSASFGDNRSPFINRALTAFNVGSAFKLCVAAAALENHLATGYTHICTGHELIDGNLFYCHNKGGHGLLDLAGAISHSCNTYFYRFAEAVGAKAIYDTATVFGFGYNKTLCDGISTTSESIPALSTLQNSNSALANFAIGQGELLASPLSMLNLYSAIASCGVYYNPTVVEGIVDRGVVVTPFAAPAPTRAMSEETAGKLSKYLTGVVENGTGTKARPDTVTAAGKTATAQTGRTDENGNAVEHSWFCGYFPAESPKYCVSVLVENAGKDLTGGEIFKKIADDIYGLENP